MEISMLMSEVTKLSLSSIFSSPFLFDPASASLFDCYLGQLPLDDRAAIVSKSRFSHLKPSVESTSFNQAVYEFIDSDPSCFLGP
ncbi:hypothetical protein L1987_80596 [Smallanthus sonchifolius]|uniref:Uncharacterized protein n=1 Tax=Smallanthus sonchifolius TaxID=185202 RepID=A0ACB8YP72_9ASTR|nr:hypothetical protein L1987_80596 [Smallanthus sonchifolius]